MNVLDLFNQSMGCHLVEQTANVVDNAQRALSSGHTMLKGGNPQRISSGWAIVQPQRTTMQFKLAAKGIIYSEITRYEAFQELLHNWNGTPSILIVFDKKPVPVTNLFITYDVRCVRVCSPKGVETFDYTQEPQRDGCMTNKVLFKQRGKYV